MDQQKTGELLKCLRREKGMTQEQLAERFHVSSRTVSRWETGRNSPDVGTLVALADFYGVDIREIIDGEKKTGIMAQETKDTLHKVAAYTMAGERKTHSRLATAALVALIVLYGTTVLFGDDTAGLLYGTVPEEICHYIVSMVYLTASALVVSYLKVRPWLEKPSPEPERTVMATVVSKEVKQGTHDTGRSVMGYSFAATFLTEEEEKLELYTEEVEFGGLREGMRGLLTYRGRYFSAFREKI